MKLFVLPIAAALLALTTNAAAPVIKAVVPEKAGVGQVVTIQGFGLELANNPIVNFLPALGGATIQCSFNIPVASNANELFVRLSIANNCSVPVGSYLINVQTSQGTSPNYAFEVGITPGTVLVKSIGNASNLPITQAKIGDKIIVTGYGIDGLGAKVTFSQGFNSVTVNGSGIIGVNGIGARVTIPAGFLPGTVLVQMSTTQGSSGSSPSNALKLTIVP